MSEKGVGPWSGPWPDDERFDPALLTHGDSRNVLDQYRYWTMDAIRADIASRARGFEVAVENLDHDFNIGSIVRTANALGAARVHIVGAKRWNRRGAMVTDRYLDVRHWDMPADFASDCHARGVSLVGIDNIPGSLPLESLGTAGESLSSANQTHRSHACLVFGSEANGLSVDMVEACMGVYHITQFGSTRSMNVGHAAAIAMWVWANRDAH